MPRPAATKRVVFGDRDYAATDIVHILRMREQRDYSQIDILGTGLDLMQRTLRRSHPDGFQRGHCHGRHRASRRPHAKSFAARQDELLYDPMIDAPEPPHQHHPAHSGHRWLDISLGLSAMFVSVISLVVAVEHGRTMERMADANERMVEANGRMVQASSWPFVEFSTHNVDERGSPDVRLVLTNEGIGPARIETFELWWKGQPMASSQALLNACCATTSAKRAQQKTAVVFRGQTAPSILRAGAHTDFLAIADSRPGELWNKFNVERDNITVRVCYCSVFDECWSGAAITTHADRVASCPTPVVPFKIE